MELNATHFSMPSLTDASSGMLDLGATASAAPAAALSQRLVDAVISRDSQATIEVDQSARPCYRTLVGGLQYAEYVCQA